VVTLRRVPYAEEVGSVERKATFVLLSAALVVACLPVCAAQGSDMLQGVSGGNLSTHIAVRKNKGQLIVNTTAFRRAPPGSPLRSRMI